jgi:TfoX/Sxy family transcriptional regulator of competence genes
MAYDEQLAARISRKLGRRSGITEKKMFGGVAFLIDGNMCCGVLNRDLVLRLGPPEVPRALTQPHTRAFDVTGRPMKGWIVVAAEGIAEDVALSRWLKAALRFAATLPAK